MNQYLINFSDEQLVNVLLNGSEKSTFSANAKILRHTIWLLLCFVLFFFFFVSFFFVLLTYSIHQLIGTRKGTDIFFELANVQNIRS